MLFLECLRLWKKECVGEFSSPVAGEESAARHLEEADDNDSLVDQISKDKDRALTMLIEILSSFIESSDRLTAEDCYHLFGLSPQAHPQTIRRQYLQLQQLTHPNQHPECPSDVPTVLTTLYSILSSNRSRIILDCCGLRAV